MLQGYSFQTLSWIFKDLSCNWGISAPESRGKNAKILWHVINDYRSKINTLSLFAPIAWPVLASSSRFGTYAGRSSGKWQGMVKNVQWNRFLINIYVKKISLILCHWSLSANDLHFCNICLKQWGISGRNMFFCQVKCWKVHVIIQGVLALWPISTCIWSTWITFTFLDGPDVILYTLPTMFNYFIQAWWKIQSFNLKKPLFFQ